MVISFKSVKCNSLHAIVYYPGSVISINKKYVDSSCHCSVSSIDQIKKQRKEYYGAAKIPFIKHIYSHKEAIVA